MRTLPQEGSNLIDSCERVLVGTNGSVVMVLDSSSWSNLERFKVSNCLINYSAIDPLWYHLRLCKSPRSSSLSFCG